MQSEKQGEIKIKLPEPKFKGMSVEDAILKRRSIRDYSGKPMTIGELSQVLFSAQGITGEIEGEKLRAAPSAGALYPIETYVFVNNVSDVEPGLYRYLPFEHSIVLLRRGNLGVELERAALGQDMMKTANIVIALTAVPRRMKWKYKDRTTRYIFIETGHISQNIYLQATSLGLGSVAVGAFYDDEVSKVLGIYGKEEIPLYLHAVGKM